MVPSNSSEMLAKAIAAHRQGERGAAMEAYRALLDGAPDHPDALHLLGVAHYEGREYREALPLIRRAIELRPDVAEFHHSLGALYRAGEYYETACRSIAQALRLAPAFLDAYNTLGLTLIDMKRLDDAETVLRQGLSHDPENADLCATLGSVYLHRDDHDAAVGALERALALDPTHGNALNSLGVARNLMGERAAALAAFEKSLEHAPGHVFAHCNYAQQLLMEGDFEQGWLQHEWRLERPNYRRDFTAPRWRGEPLDGRRILLWTEQGLGDAIQFVRFAPLVAARGGRVLVECKPRLHRLFAGVEGVDMVADAGDGGAYDLHCPIMSLPLIFETRPDHVPGMVPYLPSPVAVSPDAPDGALKIGLNWAGNPNNSQDRQRSRHLTEFAPLAEVADVALFSLQWGAGSEQRPPPGMTLVDLCPGQKDFYDTAAAMAGLDLVISVDSAAAHLAGGLGRPTWLILDQVADWRWMVGREDTPWYPTMRLFRRTSDWPGLFERMAAELSRLARDSAGSTVADTAMLR
ncbi:MAG: tetratricopeptide repeat protein [Alphaproteobacteria bacterium]|nr:tetratricopeptide repeat protein [Alphaproteobacteria bacterium]